MENKRPQEGAQRFPNKNLGQDIERDQLAQKQKSDNDTRTAGDANPLRNSKIHQSGEERQGNSSIPTDEEDTLGIP